MVVDSKIDNFSPSNILISLKLLKILQQFFSLSLFTHRVPSNKTLIFALYFLDFIYIFKCFLFFFFFLFGLKNVNFIWTKINYFLTKKHTKKSQKQLKFINEKKIIIKLSLTNRISLTSATTSRQPSAFPRNVPSRSTFHSGELRVKSLEFWALKISNISLLRSNEDTKQQHRSCERSWCSQRKLFTANFQSIQ